MPTLKWAPLGKSSELKELKLFPAVAMNQRAREAAKPVALAAYVEFGKSAAKSEST